MNELINPELIELLKKKDFVVTPYLRLTIVDVVMWIYDKYHVWLWVSTRDVENETNSPLFIACARFLPTKRKDKFEIDPVLHQPKYTPQEAYEFGIKYLLTNVL